MMTHLKYIYLTQNEHIDDLYGIKNILMSFGTCVRYTVIYKQ